MRLESMIDAHANMLAITQCCVHLKRQVRPGQREDEPVPRGGGGLAARLGGRRWWWWWWRWRRRRRRRRRRSSRRPLGEPAGQLAGVARAPLSARRPHALRAARPAPFRLPRARRLPLRMRALLVRSFSSHCSVPTTYCSVLQHFTVSLVLLLSMRVQYTVRVLFFSYTLMYARKLIRLLV